MSKNPQFKDTISRDVRDSVPAPEPYTPQKARAGALNIVWILYDNTGLAAWSPFGGRIHVPALQRLAAGGLIPTRRRSDAAAISGSFRSPSPSRPDASEPGAVSFGAHFMEVVAPASAPERWWRYSSMLHFGATDPNKGKRGDHDGSRRRANEGGD